MVKYIIGALDRESNPSIILTKCLVNSDHYQESTKLFRFYYWRFEYRTQKEFNLRGLINILYHIHR